MKILFNLFHPDIMHSRGNRSIAREVAKIPGLTLNEVGHIDVAREQKMLLEHEVIVFQHPLYWFNCPALMKEWLDSVLTMGFAYPPGNGDALQGKYWLSSITTGAPWEAYRSGGYNNFTISEFLRPFQQTAAMCQMNWLPPFALYSVLPAKEKGFRNLSDEEIAAHAISLRQYLESLEA